MAQGASVPVLDTLAPNGFFYGGLYLVEFDPDSIWYETSLTVAALALKQGTKVEYHLLQHLPNEVTQGFSRLGVDVARFEKEGLLRLLDSYTQTMEYEDGNKEITRPLRVAKSPDKPLDLVKSADEWAKQAKAGYSETEMHWLHIDDNTGIFLQYNDEKTMVDKWRTGILPYSVRARETPHFLAFAKGVASDGFFAQFEPLCDGIIELKAQEETGKFENFIRIRSMRGRKFDSSWHRMELMDNGEIALEQAREEQQRRLAAIMFTDAVGFSALAQRDESLAMALLKEQRGLIRPLIAKNRGREVKTIGDAFLVEFASSLDATKCAAEIQSAISASNAKWGEEKRVQVRIGIHLGDVIHSENDVAGDAVNVASRIEPLAPPGGICVSAPVYASVVNKVPYRFESLGTPRLKNIATPIEVFQIAGFGAPVARTGAPISSNRIAVLPFANISPADADEYFADGMTEEMISSISKTQGLKVIARTSVMKYKGANKPAGEIGAELGVGNVLEGSVRIAGDKIRITVQLVDTHNEETRWSQTYDRELIDVFAVQTDISLKVAEALRMHVLQGTGAGRPTSSPEAYVDYLRGRQQWNRRSEEGLRQAIAFFEKALAKDPTYAKAYTGLADSYATLALLEVMAPRDAYPRAKDAVGKALAFDTLSAEAHTSLGIIRFQYDWDWSGAEDEFRQAITLNPSYAPAHQYFADYLKAMGRFEEALAEIQKARELDPLSLSINTAVGHVLYLSRRYDDAIEQYKKAVELDPTVMATHVWFGRPYLEKGMYAEAISELETAVKLSGDSTLALAMLGHGLASVGRTGEAIAILARLKERAATSYVPSYWIAVIHNGLKDMDQLLVWMKKAFEERSSWLVWCKVEPRFDWARSNAEFSSLMQAMKFP